MKVKTCFLIDDDIDDQEIFELALKKVDDSIDCVFANDGAEALQKFMNDESFMPDIIFLDLNMPQMNGKQCLSEIKKISRLQHIPVIIYTTTRSDADATETKMLGALDFITKPASIIS